MVTMTDVLASLLGLPGAGLAQQGGAPNPSDFPTDPWPPAHPVLRDTPTWANSTLSGTGAYTPLPNAFIDESRFWRQPTWWDRAQQGWGGFLQNFDPTNMQEARTDFVWNGWGEPLQRLPWNRHY